MVIRHTTQAGNPVIREKAKLVSNVTNAATQRIVQDLTDSMREHNLVGMAAPQIGKSVRIFVAEVRKTKFRPDLKIEPLRVFINPRIVSVSRSTGYDWEGCGSVAESGLFAKVRRPKTVTVEAYDQYGERFTLSAKGLLARVIQHEIDHLNGGLFVDIADMKTCMSFDEYRKMRSKEAKS